MQVFNAELMENLIRREQLIAFMGDCLATPPTQVQLPKRTLLFEQQPFSVFGVMPVLDSETELFVVKNAAFVSGTSGNSISAVTTAFDTATGRPRALLDGAAMTGYRTAATSAVIADHCAPEKASRLAILGAGTQAHHHALAMMAIRDIREISIHSRGTQRRDTLIQSLRRRFPNVRIEAAADCQDSVNRADLVVAATSSSKPLFTAEQLQPHAHVSLIGGHTMTQRELSHQDLARHLLVVENVPFAVAEAGDVHGDALEPHELLAKPGETLRRRVTVFSSVGTALLDLYFVRYLLAQGNDAPNFDF